MLVAQPLQLATSVSPRHARRTPICPFQPCRRVPVVRVARPIQDNTPKEAWAPWAPSLVALFSSIFTGGWSNGCSLRLFQVLTLKHFYQADFLFSTYQALNYHCSCLWFLDHIFILSHNRHSLSSISTTLTADQHNLRWPVRASLFS